MAILILDFFWIPFWIRSLFEIVCKFLPPKKFLDSSVACTNVKLLEAGKLEMNRSDFFVYYGCLQYIKAEASGKPRHEFWRPIPDHIFEVTPPTLKQFMAEARFESIHKYWTWAPAESSGVHDPFHLVRGLIEAFNAHAAEIFEPGKYITVNESMIKWMGRDMPGWSWVPRKPAPGAQLQRESLIKSANPKAQIESANPFSNPIKIIKSNLIKKVKNTNLLFYLFFLRARA